MKHELEFIRLKFGDFKNFHGEHKVQLNLTPGLYFWTGKNKTDPQMGANGVGKSTVFDALFWVWWGKTVKDSRPANSVVPWNTPKGAPYATLVFSRNGEKHTLTRTRKPNSLQLDEKEITQEEVPGILGMNEETFRRTILIGQFGTMFLDLKPEAQSAMFSEALELDRWLKASKLASTKATKFQVTVTQANDEVNRLTGKLEELRRMRDDAKERGLAWDEEHTETVTGLRNAVDRLEATRKRLADSPIGQPKQADRLRAEVSAAKAVERACTAAELAHERSLATAEGQLASLDRELKTARNNVSRFEEAKADKTCPTCGQTVTGKHLKAELTDAGVAVVSLMAKKVEQQESIDAIKEELRLLKKNTKSSERVVLEKQEAVTEAEKSFVEWQARMESADKMLAQGKASLRTAKEEENPFTATVEDVRERITKTKDKLAEAEQGRVAAEKEAGQYDYWVKAFKEIRLSLIDEVLQELEIASAEHAARLGLVDWEIKFQTERENKSGDISYGFNVLLYPPGQKEAVRWESYSGGEDRRWQLAVTFGLSEVLLTRAGLTSNFEVLDEPAQHMSAEGVEALLECLSDRAKEQGKTIFYVDHTSLDRGYFDGVFTVQRDKDGSKVLA